MTFPVSVDDSAVAVADPDWFALAWYGQSVTRLCREQGLDRLTPATAPAFLEHCEGLASGHVVAMSPGLAIEDHPVVVGGPCIGDCTRFPTLESLYDTVQTILIGRALGAPVLLYLGDHEEAMARHGDGKTWRKLGSRFATLIPKLAAAVGWDQVSAVLTSQPEHQEALGSVGESLAKVPGTELDAAFHIGSGAAKAQEASGHHMSRRVVAAHLPAVVGQHVPEASRRPHVIVAENLQQAPIVHLVRRANAPRGGAVSYIGFWPSPSLSAAARMYRTDSWDKVPASELETIVDGSVPGLHPYTRQFYRCWLDAEQRARLAEVAAAF